MEVIAKIPLTIEERLKYGPVLRMPLAWEDFLDTLEKSEYRIEFDEGQMISFMGYATIEHEIIVANIIRLLGNLLQGKKYLVSGSNLALHIPGVEQNYFNADCTVIEAQPERITLRGAMTAIANPVLLVEVLSASTRDFDLGHKFFQYKNIPTLRQILYIDSEAYRIFSYTRHNGGSDWLLREFSQTNDNIPVFEEGSLTLEEIYHQVNLT